MAGEDYRRIETVQVLKQKVLAGLLERTQRGSKFSYDEAYREKSRERGEYGIACTLPSTSSTYSVSGVNVHPFFAGLLPEGLRFRALRQALKTSEDDLFTLLIALGGESIGDVSVVASATEESSPPKAISLEKVSFAELFEESVTTPSLISKAVDVAVPGVMPKLSTSMISFPIKIKEKRKEHILKLRPKEYPQLIENEYFFMNLAKQCGLEVAEVVIVKDARGDAGLLVTRFDRVFDKEQKHFKRLHQEDLCQVLGAYPHDKYRLNARSLAEGIQKFAAAPVIEIKKFIDLYLYSYLIGNGDLHAKNVSLLERSVQSALEISPCYDVVSTLPYGDRRMAIPLGGRDDSFRISDFVAFGQIFGVSEKSIRATVKKFSEKITQAIPRIVEIGLGKKETIYLQKTIAERIAGVN